MDKKHDKRATALIILLISTVFFGMGFMYPLLQTGYGIGPITLHQESIYLFTSFSYFFEKGEVFIGFILLFFTIILPILKYIFLFFTLAGKQIPRQQYIGTILEIINKWSMLDVFVVAVLILNMKFDTAIIISRLGSGTSLFALSVILLMVASFIAKKQLSSSALLNK